MRLSIVIRDATPRDRYIRAISSAKTPFLDSFDIAHVGQKFPRLEAKGLMWLQERLGKAITQRRQYFKYCRDHHNKFQAFDENQKLNLEMTEQQGMYRLKHSSARPESTVSSVPHSTFAPTDASTLQVSRLRNLDPIADEAIEELSDNYSQTSYAASVSDPDSESNLHPPKLKDIANTFPFECPYC